MIKFVLECAEAYGAGLLGGVLFFVIVLVGMHLT